MYEHEAPKRHVYRNRMCRGTKKQMSLKNLQKSKAILAHRQSLSEGEVGEVGEVSSLICLLSV